MSQNQRVCVWIRKYFIKTGRRVVWCANDAEHLGCGDVEEGEAS